MSLAQTHLDKLPDQWQTSFLEMYDVGCGDAEVMREFGIAPKAWNIMLNSLGESEFSEVVEFGHVLARAWWEQQGRTNLNKRGFNVRLFDINMQNRWGWARKAELETETQIVAADDNALDARLEELRNKVSGATESP